MSGYPILACLISNQWSTKTGASAAQVCNPATGDVLAEMPQVSQADIQLALDSAQRGFERWRKVPPAERGMLLDKWARLIRERCDAIATTLTLEQGKTIAEARGEVLRSADVIQWFAEEGRRTYGRLIPSGTSGHMQIATKEPLGAAALFTTWNFPASGPARKIASALAAGCSCIVKPAEESPGTAVQIVRALTDSGMPDDLVNLLLGSPAEISQQLIASPSIRSVSFTGSTKVGRIIAALAAQYLKRATLELGGHAPVLVFDDVDVKAVVSMSVAAKFRNAGQICMSPTRFYVQRRVHQEFKQRFAEAAAGVKVGAGLDSANTMGPLTTRARANSMRRLVDDAVGLGGKLLTGGNAIAGAGNFFEPTVLSDVPDQAQIMNEEPFGPVATINAFSEITDAIAAANRLPFGLAAYSFAKDGVVLTAVGSALEAGVVGLNSYAIAATETPFGGIKDSGYGLEGGAEGLDAFMFTKAISRM